MINIIKNRKCEEKLKDVPVYMVKCPCCGAIMSFGREDVYKFEDEMMIHHEAIDCPECREQIQLPDDEVYGY